ncbi:LPS export ABC transporter permease LptG [bacterium]|nr:LPS export ABC transporter permease LptG [bacterium]
MKIIDRYLTRELVTPFFLALFVFILILLTEVIIRSVEIFITNQVSIFLILQLLATSLPPILQITIPMSVLTGILIAFGRLSGDSEITALRANGISLLRMSVPVFLVAGMTWAACQYITLIGIPKTAEYRQNITYKILESNLNIGLKPHVFYDKFSNLVLYSEDLDSRTNDMEKIFIYRQQSPANTDYIFAERGLVRSFAEEKKILLSLQDGIIHELTDDTASFSFTHFKRKDIIIPLVQNENNEKEQNKVQKSDQEMYVSELLQEMEAYKREIYRREMVRFKEESKITRMKPSFKQSVVEQTPERPAKKAKHDRPLIKKMKLKIDEENNAIASLQRQIRKFEIVLHTKFAYPIACFVFSIIGIPLGIRYKSRGKSTGFSLSLVLILVYYIIIMTGEGMAREGETPAWIGIWAANIFLTLIGFYVFYKVAREKPFLFLQYLQWKTAEFSQQAIHWYKSRHRPKEQAVERSRKTFFFNHSFPRLLDFYIGREFLKKFLLLCGIIIVITIILEFITEIRDYIRYDAAFVDFITYILLRIPFFLVLSVHMAVLITTILTINIFSRNNELTAMKACGVSLYRAAMPIFILSFLISLGVLFFNERVVPKTNAMAEEISDYKIKKRSKPSLFTHNKNWYRGSNNSIYSFASFDQREGRNVLNGFLLYTLDEHFQPIQKVEAQQVHWNDAERSWYYHNGEVTHYKRDGTPSDRTIFSSLKADLTEKISDFRREIKDSDKMNYRELQSYVASLRDKGIDTTLYQTDLLAKLSMPFISFVIALFGIPFAITFQRSGTLVGIGFSIFIGMVYFVAYRMGISLGHGNQLPPFLAAWGPNLLFIVIGLYLILRART